MFIIEQCDLETSRLEEIGCKRGQGRDSHCSEVRGAEGRERGVGGSSNQRQRQEGWLEDLSEGDMLSKRDGMDDRQKPATPLEQFDT
jgi:hypothetical protein